MDLTIVNVCYDNIQIYSLPVIFLHTCWTEAEEKQVAFSVGGLGALSRKRLLPFVPSPALFTTV